MDWTAIGTVSGTLVAATGVIVGWQTLLHSRNARDKDLDRAQHKDRAEVVDKRFDAIERDIDGLTRQLAADKKDFLLRSEHAETLAGLRSDMQQLSRTMQTLDGRLFNLVAGKGA